MSIVNPVHQKADRLKAPDPYFCPDCKCNSQVYVDRERNIESGFIGGFFQFYNCRDCECKFWAFSPNMLIPATYVAGILILVMARILG